MARKSGLGTLPVTAAPPLQAGERERQSSAVRQLAAQQLAGAETPDPQLVSSVLVGKRRYDTWWTQQPLRMRTEPVLPGLEARPLQAYFVHVQAADTTYRSAYIGPPFPADGVEDLPPERAAERLAVVDHLAYDGRELELAVYRRWAAARPGRPEPHYELALMIWFHHFTGAPGPVEEAVSPLRRAIALKPGTHAYYGLMGEVWLQAGDTDAAARAFAESARLHSVHPRYHYCLSVACAASGDAAAARRALARARRVAGPKLKRRFTPGSNPLVDYRTSLLGAAARLREAREGVRAPSEREIAETSRAENLLERSDVPEELHEVVPLVERWGLGDEPSREYFVRRATRAEKKELRRALRRHEPRIVEWIDSLGAAHTQASTAFLYFLDACEELGVRPRG